MTTRARPRSGGDTMSYRVAVNGLGRIGRDVIRALVERDSSSQRVDLVAVNDLWPAETLLPLIRNDSTFGPLEVEVDTDGEAFVIDGNRVPLFARRDPETLPWGELGVDLVIESTGRFRSRD